MQQKRNIRIEELMRGKQTGGKKKPFGSGITFKKKDKKRKPYGGKKRGGGGGIVLHKR